MSVLEYGAQLPTTKVIYMHDSSLDVVSTFIEEYSTCSPLQMVTRESVGDVRGHWMPLVCTSSPM